MVYSNSSHHGETVWLYTHTCKVYMIMYVYKALFPLSSSVQFVIQLFAFPLSKSDIKGFSVDQLINSLIVSELNTQKVDILTSATVFFPWQVKKIELNIFK